MDEKLINISQYINKNRNVKAILTNDQKLMDEMYTEELTQEFNQHMTKERRKEKDGTTEHKN